MVNPGKVVDNVLGNNVKMSDLVLSNDWTYSDKVDIVQRYARQVENWLRKDGQTVAANLVRTGDWTYDDMVGFADHYRNKIVKLMRRDGW